MNTYDEAYLAAQRYRDAVSQLASGVVIVSTVDDGVDLGMTATSFVSVSLNPLLVSVCIRADSSFAAGVRRSTTWGISLLTDEHRDVAIALARRGRAREGQFDGIDVVRAPITGVPLIARAAATFEARTRESSRQGDHDLLIGDVLGFETGVAGTTPGAGPLVYWARDFRRTARD
jgi:flavin reductase (DIM6/NTAB) family NADH-FMN oxidoreductase RutF